MLPTVLTCRQGSESTGLGIASPKGRQSRAKGAGARTTGTQEPVAPKNQPHAASASPEVGWSWSGFE